MTEMFKDRIVKLLRHDDYEPMKLGQLARALGVSSEDYPQFKATFDQLRQAGHVVIGAGNLVTLPSLANQVVGTFRANAKGFGFITPLEPSSHGDLFIPPDAAGNAMTGDVVVAKVVRRGKRDDRMRYSGEIIEILERANNKFVGTLVKQPDGWLVQPDGTSFFELIAVDDVSAKNAAPKDKVVVEILSYPTDRHLARGVIVEVLGKTGRYESEIQSVIRQYHLPTEFDSACLEQARRAAEAFDPAKSGAREDITDKVVITIDPPDAKDFDDAISLKKDSHGNWVLGVHIADVSYFIPDGSALDKEAQLRGNSVYMPGRTIPMLPELLSNGICSLQPSQRRFVKSAYITYDRDGKVLSRRFTNSVMCSTQRLTYQQADKALKGRTKDVKREVLGLLKNMETLSRVIENRRTEEGMIHLDLLETELVLDESGRVVDANPADNSYPHTIIEMFMVEANEAVASLLDRMDVSFIRRIHPEPNPFSMKDLSRILRAMGVSLPRNPDRAAIQSLLAAVKERPCAPAVNMAVLRSLEKAVYAPLHVGHYALASACYCHFTSPIRRYADLHVHRLLEYYLQGDVASARQVVAGRDLAEVGKHISFTEQRAQDAEDELTTVLILQMLSNRIGEQLDCIVTGLTGFGVFVQSQRLGIEGLIQMSDLGDDHWKYDRKSQCIIGERSGHVIHLGQPMKVSITSVNVPARKLGVAPVEPLVRAGGKVGLAKKARKGRAGRRKR